MEVSTRQATAIGLFPKKSAIPRATGSGLWMCSR